jgi:hypothetical protein
MTKRRAAGFTLAVLSFLPTIMKADELNVMGTANNFAVLGASTVTNTGDRILNGSLGLYSGTSITGFPPGTVMGGVTYSNDSTAEQA